MRQAGRYLPEYRQLREGRSFVEMCTTPDLAVEVSLQPFRRFRFDAVIVFYDILFLPEAMGAPLTFTEEGPVFERPLRSISDVDGLHAPDLQTMDPRKGTGAILETLRRLRSEVPRDTAVLGFAGAPFTLAAYLIEGRFGKNGERMKRAMHEEPRLVHQLLERLTGPTGEYLAAQVSAGADAVQLFDTWAGLLGPEDYAEFALPYERAVFERVARTGAPSILYVNGGPHLVEEMALSGANVLSVDWRTDLRKARSIVKDRIALQGNLDPSSLFSPTAEVRRRVTATLERLRGDRGYVFNLGHGILPETPVESVEALVETVKAWKP